MPLSKPTWRLDHRLFRRAFLVVLACAAAAAPGTALAQDAERTVQYELDYRAPAGCPGDDAFTKLIARRTSRARRGGAGQGKYRFTVEVQLGDGGAHGTLRIAERDGSTTERDVPARDCANAFEAMALIAAVILDPRAAETTPARTTASTETEMPIETAKLTSASAPSNPARSAGSRPSAAPPSDSDRAESKLVVPTSSRSPGWQTRLRAAGALQGAVAPGLAPGVAAGAEVYRDRGGLIEPRFALTAHFAAGSTSTTVGDATFRWYAGRLTACPLGWPEAGTLTLRGCVFAEAGALHGSGHRTQNPRSSTAFWLGAGPSAEIELRVNHLLALALEAGLTLPAFHDKFVFVPRQFAHEVPTVGAWLAAGVRIGPL